MQIYSKSGKKCYFSISWAILILFVLSDRAWWGFKTSTQNFEIHVIMQILIDKSGGFKINETYATSLFRQRILILFVLSDRAWWGLRNFYIRIVKFITLCKFMQIYSKSKWKMPRSDSIQKSQRRSALPAGDVVCTPRVNVGSIHLLLCDYC